MASELDYVRKENLERVRLRVRQIARRVQDAAEARMLAEFDASAHEGILREFDITNADVRRWLREAATECLGDGGNNR